jgi:predicted amidophosphoribosyltransferase
VFPVQVREGGKVKSLNLDAIQFFTNELIKKLNNLNDFTLCVVPPHEANNSISGIKLISQILSQQKGGIDGTECVKRRFTIEPQHNSQSRLSIFELKNSLTIKEENLIKGKKVLLLDDISTTGNSLKATHDLLLQMGAEFVICIVLGRTVFDEVVKWKKHYYY